MAALSETVLLVIAVVVVLAGYGSTQAKKVLDTVMSDLRTPPEEKRASFWRSKAIEALKTKAHVVHNKNKAHNGILFIGDGMSLPTIMAARTYGGQVAEGPGEDNVLEFEKFPISGLARTYCLDAQVPDSACTATAYLTGVKTKYGVIGLDGNVTRASCNSQLHEPNWVHSIGQWALDEGLDVGLVTTTRVTHASPAGMYAHVADRNWESDVDIPEECRAKGCIDIATQLVSSDPGRRFKVIMGGGRREFLPNSTVPGKRLDNLDLTEVWRNEKQANSATHVYVTDRSELTKVLNSGDLPDYLLGLFHDDHMEYHLKSDLNTQPTLEEMVEAAIKMLSRSSKGYFLFVEGGRIDHAHHDSLAHLALDETVEYSKAVKKAHELTNSDDTLIVVSADHAHTMTVAGYPSRGNDILGVVDNTKGMDSLPYTSISYANGKAKSVGDDGQRIDVTLSSAFLTHDYGYSYPSLVPLDQETHGGEDVAVYARGPWDHLFTSSFEQNVIPHFMAYAMCLGGEHHFNCRVRNHGTGFWSTSASVREGPAVLLLILSLCAVIVRLRLF